MFYKLKEKNTISLRGKNRILKERKGVRVYLITGTEKWIRKITQKGSKNRQNIALKTFGGSII